MLKLTKLIKEASSSYYQRNREKARMQHQAYYISHKDFIHRKAKRYRSRVSNHMIIPNRRVSMGRSYISLGPSG